MSIQTPEAEILENSLSLPSWRVPEPSCAGLSSRPSGESTDYRFAALLWLVACLACGLSLVMIYPDSYQQDGGYHFIFARWSWQHPELFISVWQRPLFSLVHAVPALGGYEVSRCWAVLISTAGAAMTWLIARRIGLADSWRCIPFYLLQPALFLMWGDTMTEPLFATVLSAALLAHFSGRLWLGAVLASLLIGARPEGAFVAVVWGLMMLGSPALAKSFIKRGMCSLLLAVGLVSWVLAAWIISGDPLYIIHNWPPDWSAGGAAYGKGPIWQYLSRFPEIAGPLLMVPVAVGLWILARSPGLRLIAALFLFTFAMHSVMRVFGLFGSAGYARYFSAFAPCLAIAGCVGWNQFSARWPHVCNRRTWAAAVSVSFIANFWFVDGSSWNRDARAVQSAKAWFDLNQSGLPVDRFLWSQAAMNIAWDRDPWEEPALYASDPAGAMATLKALPPRTLICWDAETGPALRNISADSIKTAGFRLIHQESHQLLGLMPAFSLFAWGGPRLQTIYILYKDPS